VSVPRQARIAVQQLVTERRSMTVTDEEAEAAAALLADLWSAAMPHGIAPGSPGWSRHLPRAALDAVTASMRRKRGGHMKGHGSNRGEDGE
jgi:hypothetical protein